MLSGLLLEEGDAAVRTQGPGPETDDGALQQSLRPDLKNWEYGGGGVAIGRPRC